MDRPRPAGGVARSRGLTLVELMVTLTVASILAAIAVPSFSRLILSTRLSAQAHELQTSLKLARAEAIRRAHPVTLAASSASDFAQGWQVFPDADATCVAPTAATLDVNQRALRVTDALAGGTAIQRVSCTSATDCTLAADAARGCVIFTARGAIEASGDAFFRICGSTRPDVAGRLVRVNVAGNVTLANPSAVCP